MALGGAYQIDNRLMVQLSGSADGSREFMANAGVSYRFGQHSVRPGQVEAADPKALTLDQAETLAIVKSLNYRNKSQADEIATLKADKAAQAEMLAQQGAQIAELAALVQELQAKVK